MTNQSSKWDTGCLILAKTYKKELINKNPESTVENQIDSVFAF